MSTLPHVMPGTETKHSRSLPAIGLTTGELRERLRPIAEEVIQNTWAENSYFAYYDEALCPDASYAVHEYRDRKELFKLENGQAYFVKIV